MDKQSLLRALPAIGRLLHEPQIQELLSDTPRPLVVSALTAVLGVLRVQIQDSTTGETDLEGYLSVDSIARCSRQWLDRRFTPRLKPVLNLTGTIIHTNLGRAPLGSRALEAVTRVAAGYSNLEFDVPSGTRGSRHSHLESLLCELTGAEAGMAVNNNAAAVVLVLSTLAAGGEGIVSRGQLVEIGGSFRIPDIMSVSGVQLVEVGTTNKTRAADYTSAITENTKVILRVHTSNYRIVGFTEQPELGELAKVAHTHGLPLFEDLGSGALFDYQHQGVGDEPTVANSVKQGADVVSFSGDKLLGGAQAGIIVGRKDLIAKMKKHPLARALRLDKMTLAALEATLLGHLDETLAMTEIPVVHMVTEPYEAVASRAEALAKRVAGDRILGSILRVGTEDAQSTIGGGSFPGETLPTRVVTVRSDTMSSDRLATLLRTLPDTPIVSRVSHDAVLWDVRTLLPGEEDVLLAALTSFAKKFNGA